MWTIAFVVPGGDQATAVWTEHGLDGDAAAMTWLTFHDGDGFAVTPTGPDRVLDLTDEGSVADYIAARGHAVDVVKGEPPFTDLGAPVEGAVY